MHLHMSVSAFFFGVIWAPGKGRVVGVFSVRARRSVGDQRAWTSEGDSGRRMNCSHTLRQYCSRLSLCSERLDRGAELIVYAGFRVEGAVLEVVMLSEAVMMMLVMTYFRPPGAF